MNTIQKTGRPLGSIGIRSRAYGNLLVASLLAESLTSARNVLV